MSTKYKRASNSFKLDILGRPWKISVLSSEQFTRRFDTDGIAAYTLPDSKEIVFSADSIDMRVVRHELVHAHYDGLCVASANLMDDQIEEIFCDLFATMGDSILKLSVKVLRELKSIENDVA